MLMFTKGDILTTDADFDNAIMFQLPIIVWLKNEVLDYGGTVQKFNDDAVMINEVYFMRDSCTFRVR